MQKILTGIGWRRAIGMVIACACACACVSFVPFAHRAYAAAMLRCESGDKSVSYASARIGNAKCSRVNLVWRSASANAPAAAGPLASGGARAPSAPRGAAPVRREATARIYSYVEDGVTHYLTNRPLGVSSNVSVIELHFIETCNLCAPAAGVNVAALALDTRSYAREIASAASVFGVDSALVRAVIHAESAYRANAISRAGAQGLMQLMPATALRFNVGDPFDAAQNIRGGVQYLSWLLKRFNGNLDYALAAYNSGEGAVDRYNGVPPYGETQLYVSRVKTLAERYRAKP